MDPNATLRELRELVSAIENGQVETEPTRLKLYEFAEQFTALDDWITRGGFLPSDWSGKN